MITCFLERRIKLSSEVKKVNVLFVSHVSSKKFGGAERVLDDVINGLDKQKFRTTLLLQKKNDQNDDFSWDCQANTNIEYFDFGSLIHRSKLISLLVMSFRVVIACFRIGYLFYKHDIDIVCANTPIAGVYCAIPATLFGKRFFYYEHNIVGQRKGRLIGLGLKPVSKLATKIICISKCVKDSLVGEGVLESKLHLIYNGYDFQSLDNAGIDHRNLPLRHRTNVLRVGMVANFIPWKRHRLFLELIDKLGRTIPDIKIEATIVGGCLPGSENYYQEIVDWVESYRGKVDFELTGFQDNVAEYLRSFDILINPAKAEPFGLIFIEAMYLGCVVVGSIGGAAPEIIDDGITGYNVDFDNTENVMQSLTEVAFNLSKRIDVGKSASLIVKKEFSIEKQVLQIENLFLEIS